MDRLSHYHSQDDKSKNGYVFVKRLGGHRDESFELFSNASYFGNGREWPPRKYSFKTFAFRGLMLASFGRHGGCGDEVVLPDVTWIDDPYAAAQGADCLVILTEWNAFRALDLKRLATSMAKPCMADLRNVYDRADVLEAGFTAVESVGRVGASMTAASSEAVE